MKRQATRAGTRIRHFNRIAELESAVWGGDSCWLADDLEARLHGTAPIEVLLVEDGDQAVSAAWLVPLAGTQVAGLSERELREPFAPRYSGLVSEARARLAPSE